ncbi:MAG: hypothetical protein QM723_16775 [Myxococcaceae bacterium]
MRTGAVLAVLISTAAFAEGKIVYAVAWTDAQQSTMASRAIQDQVDQQLRAELARRGAAVVNAGEKSREAIVLKPRLLVDQDGTTFTVLKVGADRQVIGSVKTKVRGPQRDEKLRKLVQKAVEEVARL